MIIPTGKTIKFKNIIVLRIAFLDVIIPSTKTFHNAKIIIKDDGIGMNYEDIKNKWLFVAYSAKRLGKENEDYRDKIKTQRVFAGAKGVGRFSCDRLGRDLNLITIKDEPKAIIENLVVHWEDFENADDEEFVDSVMEPGSRIPHHAPGGWLAGRDDDTNLDIEISTSSLICIYTE